MPKLIVMGRQVSPRLSLTVGAREGLVWDSPTPLCLERCRQDYAKASCQGMSSES